MENERRYSQLGHVHDKATPNKDGFQSKEDKKIVDKANNLINATGSPTGFTNNDTITVSYDSTTQIGRASCRERV